MIFIKHVTFKYVQNCNNISWAYLLYDQAIFCSNKEAKDHDL